MEEWLGFEHNWKIWKKNLNREIRDSNQLLCCCFPKIQQWLAMLEVQEGKDEMMRTGLILGLYDSYIQQQAIAKCSERKGNKLSLKDLLEFVANLEGAHHVGQNLKGGGTSVNAMSSFKNAQKKEKSRSRTRKCTAGTAKRRATRKHSARGHRNVMETCTASTARWPATR